MSATTEYVLTAPLHVEQGEQSGVFGVVNRTQGGQIVTVTVETNGRGQETVTLVHVGDSVNFDLADVRSMTIEADSYPCNILLLNTNLGMTLNAAPVVSVSPAPPGATTFHADVVIVGAATTTLYTPTSGARFVLTSIVISTDAPGRVAIVDDADTAGSRLPGGYFAANGGLALTGEWPSAAADNVAKVVTDGAGNTFVTVEGYEAV